MCVCLLLRQSEHLQTNFSLSRTHILFCYARELSLRSFLSSENFRVIFIKKELVHAQRAYIELWRQQLGC